MKNPEDKLRLRDRIRAEWNRFVSWILRPIGYKRVGTCRLCGRQGFSLDRHDPDSFWKHLSEYHPEVMDPDA